MDEKYLTMAHYERVHEPTHMCDGRTRHRRKPTKRMLEELCERINSDGKVKHEHRKRQRS